jgi:hypothetical protein
MVSSNNGINNTVGASISGVTNTLTVTNPSNTASSAARETIVVGGGTAADPTINWNVSGVTNWEMGIDNSVSDNLTISQGTALGTNDTWRMDTSGRRLLPLQPAFSATLSTSQANATGDGTTYHIPFDSVIFDKGSNFTTGAAANFTAPVTGTYLFIGATGFGNISSQLAGVLTIVTTLRTYAGIDLRLSAVQSAGNTAILNISCIANMNAGDTAFLTAQADDSTKTLSILGLNFSPTLVTYFQGFLLG